MANWLQNFLQRTETPAQDAPLGQESSLDSRAIVTPTEPNSTQQISQPYASLITSLGLDSINANATPQTAMGISTFFGFVKLISNVMAQLPLSIYQQLDEGGYERRKSHPLDYVIHTRFNDNMSSFIARRTMVTNMLVWGYAIAKVTKDFDRNTESIYPYATKDVTPLYDRQTDKYFFFISKTGETLSQDEVIFLRDISFDGNGGISLVDWQRQTIKIDLLASKFIEKFYQDGTFMAGFFTTTLQNGPKDEEAAKLVKQRLIESFQGKDQGAFAFAVLGAGVEWHEVGKSPVEAELMKIFEKSDADISKMFNVPLSMIGDSENATSFGTGIEQQYIGVTNNVFVPIAVQIEQEFDYKCLRKDEIIRGFETQHNFKALLRGDLKTQAEYNQKMVFSGIATPDEIRAMDRKAPYKDGLGARPYMQSAMIAMEKMDERIPKNKQNGTRKENPDSGAK